MWRQTSGAVLCPSCGKLVGVNDPQCLNCGRRHPGMWGFAALLRSAGSDLGLTGLLMWACGALFVSSLVVDIEGIRASGIFSLLSPSMQSLFMFGASGAIPVFRFGRWWTPLSAGWLHGGLLHIVFNMLWLRDLVPAVAHLYGPARAVIIYTAAGVCGFGASTLAGAYLPFLPRVLRGAGFTIGASASVFGLIGALAWYGRRSGHSQVSDYAKRAAMGGALFGFLMPGIDNWAHLGGFAGGYLAARVLDPLLPERGDHMLLALACLLASALSIVVSVVTGLSLLRP